MDAASQRVINQKHFGIRWAPSQKKPVFSRETRAIFLAALRTDAIKLMSSPRTPSRRASPRIHSIRGTTLSFFASLIMKNREKIF